jgi:predicted dehydrogenase
MKNATRHDRLNMNVGVVGAGRQGWRRANAIRASHLGTLSRVADVDYRAARKLATAYSCESTTNWKEVVEAEDVEIVIVCTPPNTHAKIATSALRNQKHVLCEKPLARSLIEARKIQSAIRHDTKFKCGFNYRFHPAILQARKWLSKRRIGTPYYVRSVHGICGRPGYEKDWRTKSKVSGGGQLMDQGMHCLDLFRYFFGEFSEAMSFTTTYYWNIRVEDNIFGLLRTSDGKIASLHASWTEWKNIFTFQIVGEKGYIQIEGLGESYGDELARLGLRNFHAPFTDQTIHFRRADNSWVEEWRNFVHAIRGDEDLNGSLKDGLMALQLAQALYDSAHKKRVVSIMRR